MAITTDCFGQTVTLPRVLPYGWDRSNLRDGSFHSFERWVGATTTLRVRACDGGGTWEWSITSRDGWALERSYDNLRTATQAMRGAERAARRLGYTLPTGEVT